MIENCSSNLNRQDSFNNLTESQFDFSFGERPSTVGYSTPKSTGSDKIVKLEEFMKEIVKKFEGKIKTLKKDLNQSNKTINEIIKEKDELSFELKQVKKGKIVVFKYVENKWKYIVWKCCYNNCVNISSSNGFCREGNGFAQIKNDTEIVYINRRENGENKIAGILADNNFTKPIDKFNQTLYYYEVKIIFEKNEWIFIGLRNGNDYICLSPDNKLIDYSFQTKYSYIKLPSFTYKTNDIIGCGLVYPPLNMTNKLPYVFFTQNGKQIGKAVALNVECESIRPYVWLYCCSIEANFGDNTFNYDVSKHYLAEEFYKDEEFK